MVIDAVETVLGFLALIGPLTAISRGIVGEGNDGVWRIKRAE